MAPVRPFDPSAGHPFRENAEMPAREGEPFFLPVEDVFAIKGRGTVVTGRVERGTVRVGDEVEIVGGPTGPVRTVVTGVEMFRKLLDEARAGDNVGLLLRDVARDAVARGHAVVSPRSRVARPVARIAVDSEVLARLPRDGAVWCAWHAAEVAARVVADDAGGVRLELSAPLALEPGDAVTLRDAQRREFGRGTVVVALDE